MGLETAAAGILGETEGKRGILTDNELQKQVNGWCADELRVARLRKRITQQEIADKTGVSRASVQRYENGTRDIPLWQLFAICKVLDHDPVSIVQGVQTNLGLLKPYDAFPQVKTWEDVPPREDDD